MKAAPRAALIWILVLGHRLSTYCLPISGWLVGQADRVSECKLRMTENRAMVVALLSLPFSVTEKSAEYRTVRSKPSNLLELLDLADASQAVRFEIILSAGFGLSS